jgi:hypothetical protein
MEPSWAGSIDRPSVHYETQDLDVSKNHPEDFRRNHTFISEGPETIAALLAGAERLLARAATACASVSIEKASRLAELSAAVASIEAPSEMAEAEAIGARILGASGASLAGQS